MSAAHPNLRDGAAPQRAASPPPTPPPSARPQADASGDNAIRSAAVALLKLQGEMREARSHTELGYLIANEPRILLRAQQIVVFARAGKQRLEVTAVSSLTRVERTSPLVQWFEATVLALEAQFGLAALREFEASAFSTSLDTIRDSYPLRQLLWVPWIGRDGKVIGGTLLARQSPWSGTDIAIARHLGGAFGHAWSALSSTRVWTGRLPRPTGRMLAIIAGALALLSAVPVSMSALAPVEVTPRHAFLVTSGIEGVVQSVLVEPNDVVRKDQPLIRMNDTVQKNRLEIAEQEVLVAETKHKKASQQAFVDLKGRHELALAQAELAVKIAERDYARELLERTVIKADRDGFAFFGDRKDLIGRPVSVGERLMEIARADDVEFRIDLPVGDAIVLKPGARVKVFLDSDPLSPIDARIVRAAYQARLADNQQLAFKVTAEVPEGSAKALRLGIRGTAQVYSDRVSLGFYLFRRPIAAARQWLGI